MCAPPKSFPFFFCSSNELCEAAMHALCASSNTCAHRSTTSRHIPRQPEEGLTSNAGASQPPVDDDPSSGASQPPETSKSDGPKPVQRFFSSGGKFSKRRVVRDPAPAEPQANAAPNQTPQRKRYFSTGGQFSKRPRVDVSALTRSLIETLPGDNTAQPLLSRQLASHELPSGGRVAALYHHPNSSHRRVTFNPIVDKR